MRLICTCIVVLCVGAAWASVGEAGEQSVSGSFKWGKRGGTITGTLGAADANGARTLTLMPVWKGKPKKGYDGSITVAADGKVKGTISHRKEGTYTLTGTMENGTVSCQYAGKKSRKGGNDLVLKVAGMK